MLDTCIEQLENRFLKSSPCPLYSNLRCLVPKFMQDHTSDNNIKALCKHFCGDVDTDRTVAEYNLLRIHPAVTKHLAFINDQTAASTLFINEKETDDSSSESEDGKKSFSVYYSNAPHGTVAASSSSLHALAGILRDSALQKAYPAVCLLLRLCMTLPVTSVASERTFSKMKLIKSRGRSTMSDSRLCHLLLLSIESEDPQSIDMTHVVNHFATSYTTQPRKNLCIQ